MPATAADKRRATIAPEVARAQRLLAPSARSRSWLAEQLADFAADNADAPLDERVRLMNEAERLVLEAVAGTTPVSEPNQERAEYFRSATIRAAYIYKQRQTLEPDKGYDKQAKEWRKKAKAIEASTK